MLTLSVLISFTSFVFLYQAIWTISSANTCFMGQQLNPEHEKSFRWVLPYAEEVVCTCTDVFIGGINVIPSNRSAHLFYAESPSIRNDNETTTDLNRTLFECDNVTGKFDSFKYT